MTFSSYDAPILAMQKQAGLAGRSATSARNNRAPEGYEYHMAETNRQLAAALGACAGALDNLQADMLQIKNKLNITD